MNADRFRTLFDYNYWGRDRLFAALEGVPEGVYARENGFVAGSLRSILTHCLDAEYSWRCRFEGTSPANSIEPSEVRTPELLLARWRIEELAMRKYLQRLTDKDLAADLVYQSSAGKLRRLPNLWFSVAHVLHHSTQHRSEAAVALTQMGHSPGELDVGLFAAERMQWNFD